MPRQPKNRSSGRATDAAQVPALAHSALKKHYEDSVNALLQLVRDRTAHLEQEALVKPVAATIRLKGAVTSWINEVAEELPEHLTTANHAVLYSKLEALRDEAARMASLDATLPWVGTDLYAAHAAEGESTPLPDAYFSEIVKSISKTAHGRIEWLLGKAKDKARREADQLRVAAAKWQQEMLNPEQVHLYLDKHNIADVNFATYEANILDWTLGERLQWPVKRFFRERFARKAKAIPDQPQTHRPQEQVPASIASRPVVHPGTSYLPFASPQNAPFGSGQRAYTPPAPMQPFTNFSVPEWNSLPPPQSQQLPQHTTHTLPSSSGNHSWQGYNTAGGSAYDPQFRAATHPPVFQPNTYSQNPFQDTEWQPQQFPYSPHYPPYQYPPPF
ncbi:hypothetical protein JCM10908_006636 [Rhodotorula pacifica]|uniref:uncharacterized protein n=1 Tax=Rhodotorula pacifica TaxID=1495444 RepID=UPI00317E1864